MSVHEKMCGEMAQILKRNIDALLERRKKEEAQKSREEKIADAVACIGVSISGGSSICRCRGVVLCNINAITANALID